MIYLSWSIYQLVFVLLLFLFFWYCVIRTMKNIERDKLTKADNPGAIEDFKERQQVRKYVNRSFFGGVAIILFVAFDVGTPQNATVRSSFNQPFDPSEVVEKVELQAPNRSTVKGEFDSKIESKKDIEQ